MRVISPSFEILTELDNGSMASRIEICGRVCYKSEEKITADSAEPFIKNVLKRKHNSVAEMAVLTIEVFIDQHSYLGRFFEAIPRYFAIDLVEKNVLMMTGSVRAFRELFMNNPSVKVIKGITAFLGARYPLFFDDLKPKSGWMPQTGIKIRKVPLAEVDSLPAEQLARHRSIAVKFITNRAVTHEIVRHRPCSFLQESQRYCRYDKNQFGNEVTFIKPMFFEDASPEYAIWEKAMRETEAMYLDLLKTVSPQAARTILPNSCKTEIVVYASLAEWGHIFMQRTSPAAEPSMRELMIPLHSEFKKIFPAVFI
jgi:thymidylate synthase (FAD)